MTKRLLSGRDMTKLKALVSEHIEDAEGWVNDLSELESNSSHFIWRDADHAEIAAREVLSALECFAAELQRLDRSMAREAELNV